MKKLKTYYLSLGSNLGNREENLKNAIKILKQNKIKIIKKSPVYETEPVGYKKQAWFLNQVIEVKTNFSPEKLLNVAQSIEKKFGRKRDKKFGPREIDIDILLYENIKINKKKLKIPHIQLYKRKFVLKPLNDIAPNLTCFDNKKVSQLLKEVKSKEKVKLYESC
jgi:2-amino-4-hydroxy-6-hydroxymethyldihydropteridine diphosphokinase